MLYEQAKRYGRTPAALMGVRNAWLSWMFNRAVWMFGAWVDGRLSERDKDGKPLYSLGELMLPRRVGSAEAFIAAFGEAGDLTEY